MPKLDGTGPMGKGPLTGRGRGICGLMIHNLIGKKSRTLGFISLTIPAMAAVINDACKPNGITRRLYSAIMGRLTGTTDKQEVSDSQVGYIENARNKEVKKLLEEDN